MGRSIRKLILFTSLLMLITSCATVEKNSNRKHNSHSKKFSSLKAEPNLYTKFMWPIAKRRVTRVFLPANLGARAHDGIDIPAPNGTRIYAPAEGRVVYAGTRFNGYGKLVIIEHDSKFSTLYGHCSKLLVKNGEKVKKGTLIAQVGKTGRATAAHLHFEVRKNLVPQNPLEYLP